MNFKPASEHLEDLFFEVLRVPVVGQWNGTYRQEQSMPSKRYRALVNKRNGEVVSVVSSNYKLITHQEALELGKDVFVQLFESVKKDDLIPFKVIAPKGGASCHIDMIHKDVKLSSTKWKQDTWFPFLRVTNSYNRTKALVFEIGFVRELCSNGVIFDSDTVQIKYTHDQRYFAGIGKEIERLKHHEEEFVDHMVGLKAMKLDMRHIVGISCKALGLKFDVENKDERKAAREIERLKKTEAILNELAGAYLKEFEANAYCLFNILTDFVSHQYTYKTIPGYNMRPNYY